MKTIIPLFIAMCCAICGIVKAEIVDSAGVELPAKTSVVKSRLSAFGNNVQYNALKGSAFQDDFLFVSTELRVSKVYPNPAREAAYLDFQVIENIKAKVTIRNLLGKVVKEYDLLRGERQIKIPTNTFEAGVYFYTLSINGKALKAKKLIVENQ